MKLSKRQEEFLNRIKNPNKIVSTVAEASSIGYDDPMLIQESGEVRFINIFSGVAITNTIEALVRRNLITYRTEGSGSYTRFYIKVL